MRIFLTLFLVLATVQAWGSDESRIYAQRVSTTGTAIGSPIEIYDSAAGSPQTRPRVSFYDDRFLVLWNEWNSSEGALDVKGARIEMDGTVLDTTPLDIASGTRTQAMPDVAADTSGWMTVYQSWDSTNIFPTLYARRVDYDGTLNTPYAFGWTNNIGSDPKISWDGTNHLVLFSSMRSENLPAQIAAWSLLTTTPTATLSTDFIGGTNSTEQVFSVAKMPSGGWTTLMCGGYLGMWGSNLSPSIAMGIDADGGLNEAGYIGRNQNLAYITSAEPDLLDSNDFTLGGTAAATDASYVIGVWTRYQRGTLEQGYMFLDGDLYAARIDEYNPVEAVGGTAVATSDTAGVSMTFPSLAGDGAGNLLLVYEKATDGSTEIASKILTVDGGGITPSSEVILRTDTAGARRAQSAVAYGDDGAGTEEFLVVWAEGWWGVQ